MDQPWIIWLDFSNTQVQNGHRVQNSLGVFILNALLAMRNDIEKADFHMVIFSHISSQTLIIS